MSFVLRSENWPVAWPLTAALCVAAVLYHLGGRAAVTRVSVRRSASFYAGIGVLALAVDSPVDAYADSLFFVHMLQHVLLALVAPPLLLLGRPWPRISRPFPLPARRTVVGAVFGSRLRGLGEWLAAPLQAFALFNVVLLAWHLPALYDLTLRDGLVHDTEHALFFGTGLLFWRHLAPAGRTPVLSDPARVAYGVGAMLVGWVLAVVLAFAPDALYSAYANLAGRPLRLSALEDQQLAAGVMWVPASVPYTVAVLAAAYRWLDPNAGRRRRPLVADDLRPRET